MKTLNYMNLNVHPVQLSFFKDRTHEFQEIYHAHQGMELLIVHEGHGAVVIEQQLIEVVPGTILCFRPFQLHRIRIHNLPQQRYVRSMFVFEPAVLERTLAPFPGLNDFFRALWKAPQAWQSFQVQELAPWEILFREYAARVKSASAQHAERLLEEQLLFLTAFLHRLKAESAALPAAAGGPVRQLPSSAPGHKGQSTAEQIMTWVEAHYTEPFELERLAQAIHLSPNHVSALFRQNVGSTITEYVTARRIRQACWLLRTTDISVQEIGSQIGLGNFSYFCQLFKKNVGLTPHKFRQSAGSRV
ncbi:AraC-like ligand binding domain-containing protein [Paenibacillus sp. UNCCL117]|uniref:helix-turn-helix domain-containing protein n=1 Tax=unclassified Paenibacillus TaxID=185978 RepID=UPI000885D825|nr:MULTISPECIES: helix-turn-helix domain-containing protein [unclassified Paenibacillus]SDE07586.1 AraC-like ligand binding domain-containing protein [Paenibacillus sp. cl123]SFW59144.1 AraC-like ligand binding domain-containing protein [Paenibacillus sp. UNCCL117]